MACSCASALKIIVQCCNDEVNDRHLTRYDLIRSFNRLKAIAIKRSTPMSYKEKFINNLEQLDEEELIIKLGSYVQNLGENLDQSAGIDSLEEVSQESVQRGLVADQAFAMGERLLKRLNAEAYDLLCGNPFGDQGEMLQTIEAAMKINTTKAAGLITPLLVANLGLAPAVAAIVSTLIVQKIAKSVGDTICSSWEKTIEK